jgi:cyclase
LLTKRIIPCLDIMDGQTVKGVNFINIRNAGDPVELGKAYAEQGADELVFLDITATIENRNTFAELVKRIALNVNIPFTVGGGVRCISDVSVLLDAGADKITVNSAAVANPDIIDQLAGEFGSQCIVLAVDANCEPRGCFVYTHGGRKPTGLPVYTWVREAVERGAGEILLTSMNHDGTKKGFATDLTKKISESLPVPVIASGGAGTMDHFVEIFTVGKADAALAASIFHFGEILIPELKTYLSEHNIMVRT